MPNTPALIQKGIAGLYAAPHLTAVGRSDAEQLMGAVGEVVWFEEESMLDAVTAVSGSGPAYVFYFREALESAAQELGFSPDAARKFARQTFLGSVHLACAGAESPATLRANVTSRHGTTEAAISAFDQAQNEGTVCAWSARCGEARTGVRRSVIKGEVMLIQSLVFLLESLGQMWILAVLLRILSQVLRAPFSARGWIRRQTSSWR
jgi:pyrroline-5-carboxylate reductase